MSNVTKTTNPKDKKMYNTLLCFIFLSITAKKTKVDAARNNIVGKIKFCLEIAILSSGINSF